MAVGSTTLKLVLLGEGRVGKTSLAVRYVHGTFEATQSATVQASFLSKKLSIGTQRVELAIWDTAGQERFHSLGPIYYRDADAALLVFDITDADSFARVKAWVKELRQMVGPHIALTIVANKQDLERERAIPEEASRRFAASIGAAHLAASAKTGAGLDRAFTDTAARALQTRQALAAASAGGSAPLSGVSASARRQGPLVSLEDDRPVARQSTCCG